jgi:hypothetical protein
VKPLNNMIVVSDLHAGCRLGICAPSPIQLDDGGTYRPSVFQNVIWEHWMEFWKEWVPSVTRAEDYALVIVGDALEGVHHGVTTTVSNNINDQIEILRHVMNVPRSDRHLRRLFWVRGTEVHVGKSGCDEERVAREFGAYPNSEGQHARYELWVRVGNGLCHFLHHIGSTGSSAYESTAVCKELIEAYTEAGRNRMQPPDIVCRSHRHRNFEVRLPTKLGYGISFVTAGWQLKTPLCYRIAGARQSTPQIGGSLIRQGDHDLYTRHRVWSMDRPDTEEMIVDERRRGGYIKRSRV